jgi:hypothetical protein
MRIIRQIFVLEPWGVYVPYIYLAIIFWVLGSLSIFLNFPSHPYFMILGSYSFLFGMLQRLFFPAKKYLIFHILSFLFLALQYKYFVILACLTVFLGFIKSIRDVKSYGLKKLPPLNLLVISSPLLGAISWILYNGNYWILVPPILSYLLGVNIGVFSATLNTRPFFGIKQLPFIIGIIILYFINYLLPFILLAYFLYILRRNIRFYLTSISVILTSVITSFSSIYLGDTIHAFMISTMSPLFFSCSLYSLARYNHNKLIITIPFFLASYYLRFTLLTLSGLFWILTVIVYVYLVKDALGLHGLKYGNSKVYGI